MRKFPSRKIDWILKKQKIWFSFTLDRLFINNFFDGMIVSNNYFHPSIFFQENINKRKSFSNNYLCKYPEAWLLDISDSISINIKPCTWIFFEVGWYFESYSNYSIIFHSSFNLWITILAFWEIAIWTWWNWDLFLFGQNLRWKIKPLQVLTLETEKMKISGKLKSFYWIFISVFIA